MDKFDIVLTEEVKEPGNKSVKYLQIMHKDKKFITKEDIELIHKNFKETFKGVKHQTLIRARNVYRMTTFKGFENKDIIDYMDGYYADFDNTVDVDKFEKFFYVEVVLKK